MPIRYLRRPPKPVERKTKPKRGAGTQSPDAAYFCVLCGREHAGEGLDASEHCTAASPVEAVVKPTRP